MNANKQNAALLRLYIADMLYADGVRPARNTLRRPEPGHTGFHQPHTDGFKVCHDHPVTLLLAFIRKTELQIAMGYFGPALH